MVLLGCTVWLVSVLREFSRSPNLHITAGAGQALAATHDANVASKQPVTDASPFTLTTGRATFEIEKKIIIKSFNCKN